MMKRSVNIQKHKDVGINTIRDLTKDELIECIEQVFERDISAKFWFERCICHIADKRRKKKLEDEEAKGDRWIKLQKEYAELLKPYSGKRINEIPMDIVEKGAALEKEIIKAQEEYFSTFEFV